MIFGKFHPARPYSILHVLLISEIFQPARLFDTLEYLFMSYLVILTNFLSVKLWILYYYQIDGLVRFFFASSILLFESDSVFDLILFAIYAFSRQGRLKTWVAQNILIIVHFLRNGLILQFTVVESHHLYF